MNIILNWWRGWLRAWGFLPEPEPEPVVVRFPQAHRYRP